MGDWYVVIVLHSQVDVDEFVTPLGDFAVIIEGDDAEDMVIISFDLVPTERL